MKPIGGFFEFEIIEGESLYHDDAIKLTTGRACLNYLIKEVKPSKLYLPYYCCDALFEPMIINNIEYEFYAINEQLEILDLPVLNSNEYIIYTDFFGIKTKYVYNLIDFYADKLIVDNTHSFFLKGYKTQNYSFTSARKYFGVPDGSFLYSPFTNPYQVYLKRNTNVSVNHSVNRLLGLQEKAYSEYVESERTLNSDILRISILSEKVLSTIDYQKIRDIRNENFNFFRMEFKDINILSIDENEKDCFCYPLLLKGSTNKEKLYKEKLYIPSLWLDTLKRNEKSNFKFECRLSNDLLPLPIDHRYSIEDLKRVSKTLKNIINEK